MPKFVVKSSLEDETGTRCVDLLQNNDGNWAWVECRRDPEDSHGWRRLSPDLNGWFASEKQALTNARQSVVWLQNK